MSQQFSRFDRTRYRAEIPPSEISREGARLISRSDGGHAPYGARTLSQFRSNGTKPYTLPIIIVTRHWKMAGPVVSAGLLHSHAGSDSTLVWSLDGRTAAFEDACLADVLVIARKLAELAVPVLADHFKI